jgi:hypothetical protein
MDGIAFNGSIIDGTSMGAALDSGTTFVLGFSLALSPAWLLLA